MMMMMMMMMSTFCFSGAQMRISLDKFLLRMFLLSARHPDYVMSCKFYSISLTFVSSLKTYSVYQLLRRGETAWTFPSEN